MNNSSKEPDFLVTLRAISYTPINSEIFYNTRVLKKELQKVHTTNIHTNDTNR